MARRNIIIDEEAIRYKAESVLLDLAGFIKTPCAFSSNMEPTLSKYVVFQPKSTEDANTSLVG